jgi:hypothetical protein
MTLNTMRNSEYLDFIRSRPCWFCQKRAEPHHAIRHFRLISDGGFRRKGSDYLAIPLCRQCHEEVHSGHLKIERTALLEIIVINLVVFIAELEHGRRR